MFKFNDAVNATHCCLTVTFISHSFLHLGVCDESHSCIKKRRFTDGKDESEPEVKRISASSLKPKLAVSAPAKSAGIMMALGSKKSKAPVKMALSSQVCAFLETKLTRISHHIKLI